VCVYVYNIVQVDIPGGAVSRVVVVQAPKVVREEHGAPLSQPLAPVWQRHASQYQAVIQLLSDLIGQFLADKLLRLNGEGCLVISLQGDDVKELQESENIVHRADVRVIWSVKVTQHPPSAQTLILEFLLLGQSGAVSLEKVLREEEMILYKILKVVDDIAYDILKVVDKIAFDILKVVDDIVYGILKVVDDIVYDILKVVSDIVYGILKVVDNNVYDILKAPKYTNSEYKTEFKNSLKSNNFTTIYMTRGGDGDAPEYCIYKICRY